MAFFSVRRKFMVFLGASIAFSACAFVVGGYLGFANSKALQKKFGTPHYIAAKAKRGYGSLLLQERPERVVKSSNRLNLLLTEYFIPLEFKNGGGGIAVDGAGGVLLVDLSGNVFRYWDGRIEQLDVVPPDSNADALRRQLNDGTLGNITINFGHFRFNDVLPFSSGEHRYLLVSYTEWHEDRRCFTSTLASALLDSTDPSEWSIKEKDWVVVARTRPCLPPFSSGSGIRGSEAGGRMISSTGSEVLWTSGAYHHDDDFDRTHPEEALAQRDDSDYGKIMLVDIERHTVRSIAKGLRNPQGIDIDEFGNIWVTDHGMRGGDELNLVKDGANFGYPLVTLGTKYTGKPGGMKPVHAGHHDFDKPAVAFVPSIAPSSALYVKDFDPNWDGSILIGGLNRKLYRVYMEDGDVLLVEPIEVDLRIRDMARLDHGKIVMFTNDNKLAIMEPASASPQYNRLQMLLAAETDLELRNDAQETLDSCLECHRIEEGSEAGAGPKLYQVCGRKPGTDNSFKYSDALISSVDIWDHDNLVRFISDPDGTAPGTSMAWGGIERPEVAELLAKTLCQLAAPSTE